MFFGASAPEFRALLTPRSREIPPSPQIGKMSNEEDPPHVATGDWRESGVFLLGSRRSRCLTSGEIRTPSYRPRRKRGRPVSFSRSNFHEVDILFTFITHRNHRVAEETIGPLTSRRVITTACRIHAISRFLYEKRARRRRLKSTCRKRIYIYIGVG